MIMAQAIAGSRRPWWVKPWNLTLLILVPTAVLSASYSEDDYFRLWRTPRHMTDGGLWLVLALAVTLAAASLGGALARWRGTDRRRLGDISEDTYRELNRWFGIAFALTVLGYAAWIATGVVRGIRLHHFADALTANYDGEIKRTMGTVPGVTTLTQAGIAVMCLGAFLGLKSKSRKRTAAMVAVVVLALFRAFFLTERLAVIECAVPLAAIRCVGWSNSRRPSRRLISAAAPAIAVVGLFSIFATFELTRSWTFYSSRTNESYVSFMADRLAGYYATSYNNGDLLEKVEFRSSAPLYTAHAFWEFPGVASLLPKPEARTALGEDYEMVLSRYASLEFNSTGGVTTPLIDFGVIGGFLYTVVFGAIVGAVYAGYARGSLLASLCYPVVFGGLLDLPRELYLNSSRIVPAIGVLVFACASASRKARRSIGIAAATS